MSAETPSTPWHALTQQQLLASLQTDGHGLDSAEAEQRLQRYGGNRLPQPARPGPIYRFLMQFHNVLIYVLLAAAAVAMLLRDWVDFSVIAGVVFINAIIGFVQEGKAEKALEAVRHMLSPSAIVFRDGQKRTLSAEVLVPGDVVFLQSGDRVPADLRLLRSHQLHIDEAMLTGESLPADKKEGAVEMETALGDRTGMAYSGTFVAFGQGAGIVVATGAATEIGRISSMLSEVTGLDTPLMRQMRGFARWLTAVILLAAAGTAIFGVVVQGYAPVEMYLAAVGLAVAAIPEGLPAIITITMAIGVQRMAQRQAIIRRLPAVETLGSVTTICTDKTGTLTCNEMTVKTVALADGLYEVEGSGYRPHGTICRDALRIDTAAHEGFRLLCRAAVLCNDAALMVEDEQWRVSGDPTEGALLVLAIKAGFEPAEIRRAYGRNDAIPFESQHRFMASLHQDVEGNGRLLLLKGAPEVVLPRCDSEWGAEGAQPLDLAYWQQQIEVMAEEGQRTLALAMHRSDSERDTLHLADVESGLVLVGMVGIVDPPRDEAVESIQRCREAGIRVKMITGDHATTARVIAAQLGIGDGRKVLTGQELARLDDEALRTAVAEVDVFARTSPEDKLRLVMALQAEGHVIVMTGDGVNDAPALKRADVGVAMGIKGTEVSKEAAEMVLADDNFISITSAVEEGRTVYDNIRKSILFILPTSFGEAFTIITAIAAGTMLPVTAAQILWINMITAVTLGLALAFEPPEAHVMQRSPRMNNASLLTPFMLGRIFFVSLLMVVGTFGLFSWEMEEGMGIDYARTVAVNTLVFAELFYLFNARYLVASSLRSSAWFGNRAIYIAVGVVILFQLLFTYQAGLQFIFASESISAASWLRIVVMAAIIFMAVEMEKALLRRLQKSP